MLVYFVIGKGSALDAKVKSVYPNHHEVIDGGWVVAVDNKTTSEVSESLGMNSKDKNMGVIVKAEAYYGYYNNALWEKISLWRDEVASK